MKKRITLLGIIVGILTLLNIGTVSAVEFNFVPEPVYDLLRKIFILLGAESGSEQFIIFIKFVMFFVIFTLFFYGFKTKFGEQNKNMAITLSAALSLFSVILIPGAFLARMAEIYAGVFSLLLPGLLVFMYLKNLKEIPAPLKLVIDLVAMAILASLTDPSILGNNQVFGNLVQYLGLFNLFFLVMAGIHLFETIGFIGEHTNAGKWAGSAAGAVAGATVGAANATAEALTHEFEKSDKIVKMEEKLDTDVIKELTRLEKMDLLTLHDLNLIKAMIVKMVSYANDLARSNDEADHHHGYIVLADRFRQFKNSIQKISKQFKSESNLIRKVLTTEGKELRLSENLESELVKLRDMETKLTNLQRHTDFATKVSLSDQARVVTVLNSISDKIIPKFINLITKEKRNYAQAVTTINYQLELFRDEMSGWESFWSKGYKPGYFTASVWQAISARLQQAEVRVDDIITNFTSQIKEIEDFRNEASTFITIFVKLHAELEKIEAHLKATLP